MSIYSEDMDEKPAPIHVIIDRETEAEELGSADYGSWATFIITNGIAPQQLLPQSDKRLNAYIMVAGSATGYVLVGSRAQVMNNQGGRILASTAGNQMKYEAQQEVWIASDNTTASITVTTLDHRYA